MVLDAITGPAFGPFSELLNQTVESIIETILCSKNVLIDKKSFGELSSYLNRVIPLLKELKMTNLRDSQGTRNFIDILNREVKEAKLLITECSERNKVYLLMHCRSIAKRIENITTEISQALRGIPLATLDISSGIKEEITLLIKDMHDAEFRASIAEEEIMEKIESGIQERNVQRSYANSLLAAIADAVGISTERSVLRKEIEEFKKEIENAKLRKDHAEAIQMEQIIALLERADVTYSREDKEKKYLLKRKSLGSQPLEPLQSFYCPITAEVMEDPVEAPSGHTYERSAIEKWLAEGKLCPMTLTPLSISMLRPNKTLRQSIEEWKDRNTMIIIASMKSKLSSVEEGEVLNCLEQLKHLCEEREIHREWILLENYIPGLIKVLDAKNQEIRSHALVILAILAKDSDEAKESIAKVDNAMRSIVRSLGRRVGERKLAVGVLLQLSKSELARDCIGKAQGCILLLVTMSKNEDNQASEDARDVLENLSFSNDNVIQMAKANYFKYLLQRLASGPDEVKMMMAKVLGEIEFTDPNKSSLFEEGVLDLLLRLVLHGDNEMKQVAIKALLNLSSFPKNGLEMIRQGAVRPLLDILYRHSSPPVLRELAAATIMNLAVSTTCQDSLELQVSLLESEEDINQLFSLINMTGNAVQQNILRALHALCQSPSAANVKAQLKECSAVQVLVQLCEVDDLLVRASVVKLLCCLAEDCDAITVHEQVGRKTVQTILKIIKNSDNDEEIASAMGVISCLPMSTQVSEWLLEEGGLQVIFSFLPDGKQSGLHKNRLVENAVGALCHFTVPENKQSQKKAAEAGIIPVLVQLLEVGTGLTKRRAAISLGQLSESSHDLSRPIPKRQGFWCFSGLAEEGCHVHQGVCSVKSSFCLVEAGAIGNLVRVLGEADSGASEAALDALLSLIKGERLQNGVKVLEEANAIPSMIRLLGSSCPRIQEKVLLSLGRMFRLLEFKQRYGMKVNAPLIDLTQRGTSQVKSLAAKVLAQLDVLHEQSSYF